MRLFLVIAAFVVLGMFAASAAQAHHSNSLNAVGSLLYNSNVDGRCGSGADVVCIKYNAGGLWGPQWANPTPNCWGYDWDGDGHIWVGDHDYQMYCRWGERYIYLVDTRRCNGYYRVSSHDGSITGVYQGRNCWGDW